MPEITGAVDVVREFYQNVKNDKFERAFELLCPEMRERRWQSLSGRFVDGYRNLVELEDFVLTKARSHAAHEEWLIYTQERVNAYFIENVLDLQYYFRFKVGQISADNKWNPYADVMEHLLALGADPKVLADLPLFRFIYPNSLDDIRWLLNLSHEQMLTRFKAKELRIEKVYRAFCKEVNGGWHIYRILPVNFGGTVLH